MKKTTQKFMAVLVSILMVLSSGAVDLRLDARVANRGAYVTAEAAEEDPVGDPDEAAEPVVEQIPKAEEPEEQPPVEQPAEEAAPAEPETIVDTPDSGKAQNDVQPIVKDETPADKGEAGTIKEEKEEPELPTIVQPDKAPEKVNDKADDPKDNKEDEKPEEVKMPAFSDSATTAGGITVSVSAPEGVFPEGTVLRVADVSSAYAENVYDNMISDDRQVSDARAVDITFYDKDGNEIEPLNSVVHVSISLPTSIGGDDFSVLHQTDAGAIETVTKNASSNGASFLASSFSVYVIIGTDPVPENETAVPRITYIFYSNETVVDTQIIKNSASESDEVKEPAVPELDGYEFVGWTTEQNADADSFTRFQFGHQDIASYTADTTIPVYAVYREAPKYQVIFMNGVGTDARIAQIKRAKSGDTVTVDDVILPLDSVHSVVAWCTDEALHQPVASVTVGAEDIKLYPDIRSGHYITFESEGGSYIRPQFVPANGNTVKPANPTRHGYEFVGWENRDISPATSFTFGGEISKDITLYAKWKAVGTTYTVIYWKQSVNDPKDAADSAKTYDYAGSALRNGTSEQRVSSANAPQLNSNELVGFKLSSKTETITIKGDGTSILNVYYDRKLITFKFYHSDSVWNTSPYLTMTGLYGQTLRQNNAVWPDPPSGKRWYGYELEKSMTFLDGFTYDINVINFKPRTEDLTFVMRHYLQDEKGNWGNDPANTVSAYKGRFQFTNKYNGYEVSYYRLEGQTKWKSVKNGDELNLESYVDIDIRHSRKYFKFDYYNHDKTEHSESVIYGGSLAGYGSKYNPPRPTELSSEFEFTGWYKDKECTELFDFNITMPADDLIVYAGWKAPNSNARAYHTISGGAFSDIEVEYGGLIDESTLPNGRDLTPSGMKWIGWATKNGDTYTLYNFNERVFHDIELYPYYISNESHHINYDANGGTGTVRDEMAYSSGVYATVKSDQGLTPPLDKNNNPKVFLGWSLTQNGAATYYPGAKLFIDGHGDSAITLYAVWGDSQTTTTVTYHANYPDGTDATELHKVDSNEKIINNSYIILKSPADLGFSKEKYNFVGWSRTAAGPAEFNAGSKVGVDNNGNISSTNNVYGIWEVKKEVTVTIKGGRYNKPYDGKEHSVSFELTSSDNSYDLTNVYYNYQGSEYQYGSDNAKISGKDVCDLEMGLSISQFVNKDSSVKVTFVLEQDAKLKIEPFEIVINAPGKEQVYNGKELKAKDTNPGYTPTSLPNGETIKVDFSGSVKHVSDGEVKITYNITWLTAKKSNYTINDSGVGYLKITPKTVTVKSRSLQKEYDGTPLTNESVGQEGVEETKPETINGFIGTEGIVLKGKGDGQTKVGSTLNEFTYEVLPGTELSDYNLPENLGKADSVTVGTLVVVKNPAKIIITAPDDVYTYDGKPFKTSKEATVDGLPAGFTCDYEIEGTFTHVAETAKGNTVIKEGSVKIFKGNEDVTDQFEPVKTEAGTTTINPAPLTVTTKGGEWTYDGQEHTKNNVEAGDGTVTGLVNGEKVKLEITGKVKNVAESGRDNTYEILWKGQDPTATAIETDYKVTEENLGKLIINPAKVTLQPRSLTKEYDGTPLTNDSKGPEVTETKPMSITGWAPNEGINEDGLRYKGSVTLATEGVVKNEFDFVEDVETELAKIANPGTDVNNYKFDLRYGELKITNRNAKYHLIVTANSDDKPVYDGKPHTVEGLVPSSGAGCAADEYIAENGLKYRVVGLTALTTKTDANEAGYEVPVIVKNGETEKVLDENGNDVSDQFEVERKPGTLTIHKKPITITTNGDSKTYDGTPLTNPGYKVEGIVSGETYGFKTTGKPIHVDDPSENTYEMKWNEDDPTYTAKKSNYTIESENLGKLTIEKVGLTVTTDPYNEVYDGESHGAGGRIEGFVNNETATLKTSKTVKNVSDGEIKNTYEILWKGEDSAATAQKGDYEVTKENIGTLQVTKKDVTITSRSLRKEYDGEELSNATKADGVKVVETQPFSNIGWVGNEGIEEKQLNFTTKLLTGGEKKDNEFTEDYVPKQGTDLRNYHINPVFGTLEITDRVKPYEITVEAEDATFEYDGKEHPAAGEEKPKLKQTTFTLPDNNQTYTVEGLDVFVIGSGKDYKEDGYPLKVTGDAIVKDAQGNDVTKEFKVNRIDGTLTITKRPITLRTDGDTKEYDGTPLMKPGVEIVSGSWAEGEDPHPIAIGEITEVGTKKNAVGYKVMRRGFIGADEYEETFKGEENYEITVKPGTLEITKNTTEITVTAASDSKTYDGTPLEKNKADVDVKGKLPQDHTTSYTVKGSITDVDVKAKDNNEVVEFKIFNANGKDVTNQFSEISYNKGTLTINKRKVILTSETAEKPYDGTPLTKPNVTVEGDGFVEGEISDLEAIGTVTRTDEGEQTNTIVWTKLQNYKDSNYFIDPHPGILKITANTSEIVVRADSGNRKYDGTAFTKPTYTTTGLPAGLTAEATIEGSVTNVREGTVANVVKDVVIKDADKNDVTNQFTNINKVNGSIYVEARNVRLISKSAQKVFDNTPLTEPEVTVEGDDFVAGEVTDLHARGSITRVGNTTNDIVYTKTAAFIDSNYNITEEIGTLVVIPSDDQIVVTSGSATKMYDGTPLTLAGVTATMPARFTGYTVQANTTGTVTNVNQGAVRNAITGIRILDPTGNDVTNNFEADAITVVEGTLTITPRTVVLTSGSATKAFDGTPITNYQIIVTGDGFVAGEGLLYNVTGAQTAVGSSDNTFGYTAQAGTQLTNYQITVVPGTLTITEGAIVPINPPAPVPVPPQPNPQPNPQPDPQPNPVTPTTPEVIQLTPTVPTPSPTPDVVQVDDVETPLANIPEKCNALPFLLLLAAWIVLMIFAASMKKQQKRIFEMTEEKNNKEIDIELLSRKKQTSNKM